MESEVHVELVDRLPITDRSGNGFFGIDTDDGDDMGCSDLAVNDGSVEEDAESTEGKVFEETAGSM